MLPLCETTGHPARFCDCDTHDPARRALTPLLRRDRDTSRTDWLTEPQERALRSGLAHLPEMAVEVSYLLRGERIGEPVASAGTQPQAPISADVAALTKRGPLDHDPIAHASSRGMVTVLHSWVRLAHGEMLDDDREPADLADMPTVSSETGWLLRHIVWVLAQQWVDELAEDVARLVKDCRRVLRERPAFHPPCLRCGNRLEERVGFYACGSCGQDYREEAALRDAVVKAHPLTPPQIERGFGIMSSTVRKWQERGLIEPATDDKGEPLRSGKSFRYHVADVLRLHDANGTRLVGA